VSLPEHQPFPTTGIRLTRRGLLLTLSASLVAACTPTTPSAGGSATAVPGAPAPTARATAASGANVSTGGTLRLPISIDPIPLNGVISNELSSLLVRRVLFSYLTRVDPATKQAVPDLATKWDVSADGLTWTFTLRNDVKWHDGQPFSADDVKFTFDQILDPANSSVERSNYLDVSEVVAVDPRMVRFQMKNPLMSLPIITGATVGILPKHLLQGKPLRDATEFNNVMPIGTGPFKMKSITSGSDVQLVANEAFYRGRPKLDAVIFKIVPDSNVVLAQLKSGELDFATVEAGDLAAVQNDPNLVLKEYPAPEWWYYVVNEKNSLFSDKRVRQALVYGLDRDAILKAAALNHGVSMTATIPSALSDWYDASLKPYPFDVAKAKSLLSDAGWMPGSDSVLQKAGQKFSFKISLDNTSAARKQMAVLAQQYWKTLGLDPTIDELSRTVWAQNMTNRTIDISVANTPSSWDPDTQRRFYLSNAGSNFGQYSNPDADKLLNAGVAETDTSKRKSIYVQYQQLVYDDVNAIAGYYPNELRITAKKLQGLPDLPIRDVMTYMDQWYFQG
jgi:peptide/nickel transport system substrate-binding protein